MFLGIGLGLTQQAIGGGVAGLNAQIASAAGIQPAISADLKSGQAWLRGAPYALTSLPGWSFSRALAAYGETSAGVLQSFASGAPRLVNGRGQLIEGARTNLCLRSQEFDNASWSKSNLTVTADAIAAPDGTTTADLLTVTTTAATSINQSVGAVTGTNCCASIYVQNNNRSDTATSYILYDATAAANRVSCSINWANMTVSGTGASIQRLGSTNWYRIIMVDTSWTTGNTARIYPGAAGGSLAAGLAWYQWGSQIEAAAFPSSYIPTTTASVTRPADIPLIDLLAPLLYDVSGQPELVTNGAFASDTAWTKGTGWTISGGAASQSGAGSNSNLSQNIGLSSGKAYMVTITVVSRSAGSVRLLLGGGGTGVTPSYSAAGTYTSVVRADSGGALLYVQADATFVGTVDDVSVKEIPASQVINYPLTMYARFERVVDTGGSERVLVLNNADNSDRAELSISNADLARFIINTASANQMDATISGAIALNTPTRTALRIAANDAIGAKSGSLSAQDTSVTLPGNPTILRLGHLNGPTEPFFGYLSEFAIWAEAVNDNGLTRVAYA
jgi:hypothetical protein